MSKTYFPLPLSESILEIDIFAPTASTTEFLKDVDEAIREIDSERPLSDGITKQLHEQILYDRVFSSAVTEGNRLSLRETIVVLTGGIVESGKRKDAEEVKNLAQAIVYVSDFIKGGSKLTAVDFREIHSLLLNNIDDCNKGKYRNIDVAISGAKLTPPSHVDVPQLITSIFESGILESEKYHPLQKAAWVHWALVRIHPFIDGNGRAARLIQDYVLLRDRYVPATIQATDREATYYNALEDADLGNGVSLLELVAKNTIKTSDKYLSIIRDGKDKANWITNITNIAKEKVRQTEHREFLSVLRAAASLKSEFKNICEELHKRIPNLYIRFKDYGGIDFDQYKEISIKGRARRTWDFGIEISIPDQSHLRYMFWYTSHFRRSEDLFVECPSKVVLMISCEDNGYYQTLDDINEDKVTLREVVPLGTNFMRRRKDPVGEAYVWDSGLSATKIVTDFIQEALSKIGLV